MGRAALFHRLFAGLSPDRFLPVFGVPIPSLMPSAIEVLWALHVVGLTGFVGATSVCMLVAILARLRVRRPRLVWRTGPLTGVPIGPSLFLGGVAGALAVAGLTGSAVAPSVGVGYPAGGLFWFVATWLARSVVITDYGLVHDLPRLHRAVAWRQIVDYVDTTREGRPHFIFFYRDADDQHRRLDLPVPDRCVDPFRRLVSAKLDDRLAAPAEQAKEEVTGSPGDSLDGR